MAHRPRLLVHALWSLYLGCLSFQEVVCRHCSPSPISPTSIWAPCRGRAGATSRQARARLCQLASRAEARASPRHARRADPRHLSSGSPTTSPSPATSSISACRRNSSSPRTGCTISGSPDRVTAIPGNHDAYVRLHPERGTGHWLPYMQCERRRRGAYPDPADRLSLRPPLRRRGLGGALLGHPDHALHGGGPARLGAARFA